MITELTYFTMSEGYPEYPNSNGSYWSLSTDKQIEMEEELNMELALLDPFGGEIIIISAGT